MTLTEINTEAPKNVIKIHTNPERSTTEVIDLNINTNVTVSSTKVSKIFQKTLVLLVIILAAAFTVVLFNVKGELHTLRAQVQCMDTKLEILMSKYEKVSGKLNRVRSHLTYDKLYQPADPSDGEEKLSREQTASAAEELSLEIYKKLNDSGLISLRPDSKDTKLRIPFSDLRTNSRENILNDPGRGQAIRENGIDGNDTRISAHGVNADANANGVSRRNADGNVASSEIAERLVRENLTLEGRDLIPGKNIQSEDYDSEDDLDAWSEPRTGRARRDDGRGKKRGKSDPRPKRSRRRLVPMVATFIGGVPEQHVVDRGFIGPWVKHAKDESRYDLNKFHLVDDKKSIEVTLDGLYMISAQIFYYGEYTHYSYWILLNSEGESVTQKISKCSTVSNAVTNEVSCHTSVVLPLRRGDRLHIQQQERDRVVNLREGHSYVQLVLLSGETHRKRIR